MILEERQRDIRKRLKEALIYWTNEMDYKDREKFGPSIKEEAMYLASTEVLCLGFNGIMEILQEKKSIWEGEI